ncbi:hypothetical protein JCM11251_002214 [Rhodosporidiobolus azoricus]
MKGLPLSHPPSHDYRTEVSSAASFRRSLFVLFSICLVSACFGPISSPASSLDLIRVDTLSELWKEVLWRVRPLPKDPMERALRLMERSKVIDGHVDLPILGRWYFANQINDPDFDLRKETKGQVDIPRLREGKVGGFFWSVFVPCPEDDGYPSENDGNFTSPSFRVRDTIEQIDTARLLIDKYSDVFDLSETANDWRRAMKKGKIGGMLGVEGGHQLGSSLSTLRAYHALGVRYVTLTHSCNSPLADSSYFLPDRIPIRWNGVSPFGYAAIAEMNRLGIMVDVSHTHPKSASDALSASKAPVIFSHSNARGVHPVVRNVPDSILRRIGNLDPRRRGSYNLSEDGEQGQGWGATTGEDELDIPGGDAIVMLNFSPGFVSEFDDGSNGGGKRADVKAMADHADYIGKLAGRDKVGLGSDFDGITAVPEGLEDVSKYPNLVAELISRGWSDKEILGFTSGNIIRILEKVEAVSRSLKHAKPRTDVFEGRTDLVKHDSPPGLLAKEDL